MSNPYSIWGLYELSAGKLKLSNHQNETTNMALNAFFPLISGGKLPAIDAWNRVKPGSYPAVGNYGIALDPEDLVLDGDPRNYPPGKDTLADILSVFNLPLTRVVKTARGGYHFYFKKPASLKLRRKQAQFPGVDFLSDGAYVVGPGSQTIDGAYQLLSDLQPADLPPSFLQLLETQADRIETGAEPSLLMGQQFKRDCELAAPAIEGSHGDDATYQLACRGRDYGLPVDLIYQHMRDSFNPRCSPPWDDAKLFAKVKHAFQYAKNAAGSKTPEAKFTADMAPPAPQQIAAPAPVAKISEYQARKADYQPDTLIIDNKGFPTNTAANVTYLLRHDSAWRGQIKYNQFSSTLEFVSRPPWREDQYNTGLGFNKRDLSCMLVWFSSKARLEIAESTLKAGLQAAATTYHPVREYLDGLRWDGIPRLDMLLKDTAGADDTAYTRAVSKCMMIGAVKRIYEPGCKQDYVVILEGPQGTRKSMWIATLGGDWYSASELTRGDKDTYQNLRGRWFVELPEINATFTKADFAWLKGVISCATDVYRASYGTNSESVPRESIFIGTINPKAGRSYLKDDENRRYWPVKTRRMDVELLAANRDQYFAEAVHRYKQGEQVYIDDAEAKAQAKEQQAARQEVDPWIEILGGWLASQTDFTPLQVYTLLGFNGCSVSSHHRIRLYSALHVLGWEFKAEVPGSGKWVRRNITWEDLL